MWDNEKKSISSEKGQARIQTWKNRWSLRMSMFRGFLGLPKTVAAGPMEVDRANYNFPIKTSVEETPLSTSSRESRVSAVKRNRSSTVKNVRRYQRLSTKRDKNFDENSLRLLILLSILCIKSKVSQNNRNYPFLIIFV